MNIPDENTDYRFVVNEKFGTSRTSNQKVKDQLDPSVKIAVKSQLVSYCCEFMWTTSVSMKGLKYDGWLTLRDAVSKAVPVALEAHMATVASPAEKLDPAVIAMQLLEATASEAASPCTPNGSPSKVDSQGSGSSPVRLNPVERRLQMHTMGSACVEAFAKFAHENRVFTAPAKLQHAYVKILYDVQDSLTAKLAGNTEIDLVDFLHVVHSIVKLAVPEAWIEMITDLACDVAEKSLFPVGFASLCTKSSELECLVRTRGRYLMHVMPDITLMLNLSFFTTTGSDDSPIKIDAGKAAQAFIGVGPTVAGDCALCDAGNIDIDTWTEFWRDMFLGIHRSEDFDTILEKSEERVAKRHAHCTASLRRLIITTTTSFKFLSEMFQSCSRLISLFHFGASRPQHEIGKSTATAGKTISVIIVRCGTADESDEYVQTDVLECLEDSGSG